MRDRPERGATASAHSWSRRGEQSRFGPPFRSWAAGRLAPAPSGRSRPRGGRYNRRDFPDAAVRTWGIEVQGPSTFQRGIYDLEPGLFVRKLHEQAGAIGLTRCSSPCRRTFRRSCNTSAKNKASIFLANRPARSFDQAGTAEFSRRPAERPGWNPPSRSPGASRRANFAANRVGVLPGVRAGLDRAEPGQYLGSGGGGGKCQVAAQSGLQHARAVAIVH